MSGRRRWDRHHLERCGRGRSWSTVFPGRYGCRRRHVVVSTGGNGVHDGQHRPIAADAADGERHRPRLARSHRNCRNPDWSFRKLPIWELRKCVPPGIWIGSTYRRRRRRDGHRLNYEQRGRQRGRWRSGRQSCRLGAMAAVDRLGATRQTASAIDCVVRDRSTQDAIDAVTPGRYWRLNPLRVYR